MAEYHISESQLAELDEGAAVARPGDHLSWCRECQNAAAEFRWIGRELAAGMREDAARLRAPSLDWRSVAIRAGVAQRRAALLRCGSLAASMLLMVCTFAVTSSLMGMATSDVGTVGPPPLPHPVLAETRRLEPALMATPAPESSTVEADGALTPVLVPLPTPP